MRIQPVLNQPPQIHYGTGKDNLCVVYNYENVEARLAADYLVFCQSLYKQLEICPHYSFSQLIRSGSLYLATEVILIDVEFRPIIELLLKCNKVMIFTSLTNPPKISLPNFIIRVVFDNLFLLRVSSNYDTLATCNASFKHPLWHLYALSDRQGLLYFYKGYLLADNDNTRYKVNVFHYPDAVYSYINNAKHSKI